VAAPSEARTPHWHRAKSLTKECGWKGGDRGGLAERKKWQKSWGEQNKLLTGIGLLMEGFSWQATPDLCNQASWGWALSPVQLLQFLDGLDISFLRRKQQQDSCLVTIYFHSVPTNVEIRENHCRPGISRLDCGP
jgi:hypothetical protein